MVEVLMLEEDMGNGEKEVLRTVDMEGMAVMGREGMEVGGVQSGVGMGAEGMQRRGGGSRGGESMVQRVEEEVRRGEAMREDGVGMGTRHL